jgi:hypothetical protein
MRPRIEGIKYPALQKDKVIVPDHREEAADNQQKTEPGHMPPQRVDKEDGSKEKKQNPSYRGNPKGIGARSPIRMPRHRGG